MTSLDANPLAQPSTLPYGMPDFAAIADEHYRAAALAGMTGHLAEIDAIATHPEPPTVSNLLDAWEASGRTLTHTLNAFFTRQAADTNDVLDAIEEELAPLLSAHADAIMLDRRLYDRCVELQRRADAGEVHLDPQAAWLLSENLREFRQRGVGLDDASQQRLRALNAEIASLQTEFGQVVIAGRNAAAVHVTDQTELEGLSEAELAACREAAQRRGVEGWVLELVNTTGQPMLGSLRHRDLRARLFHASVGRGLSGDTDTRAIVVALARLRSERATLLGYEHHAAAVADQGCAKTTAAVNEILGRVGPAAVANARREAAALQAQLDAIEPGATLEPWDWQYLAELERVRRFSLDDNLLRPYLDFHRVLVDGVFAAATELYGIMFAPLPSVVGYTADCVTYEVAEADGTPLALVVIDPYARPSKQGGAWMTSLVDQSHLLGDRPVVTNNCNLTKPADGRPTLMSWDNVITLFHEFGHDLHGLLSDVRYGSRAGTATPRDFVEFPSQVNEMWAWDPDLIARYAVHHDTGEPIPAEWIETKLAARHFDEGYEATETFAAMVLDQAWHQTPLAGLPTAPEQVEGFEAAALAAAGMDYALVPPRYRTAYFSHIWGGGYSAAYYSYLWSEVMDADTVAWFTERGGRTRENGEVFRRGLLAKGGSVDVMESYRSFRGADPDVRHVLERRGLAG